MSTRENTGHEKHSKYLVHLDEARTSDGLANRCHQSSAFIGELRFTVLDLFKVTLLALQLVDISSTYIQ